MNANENSHFVDWSAVPAKDLFPGIRARLVSGEKLMLARVELAPNALVPEHQHPHEQFGLLLEGEVDFTIGGERKHLVPGDYYIIPGNTPHKVETGPNGAVALDIFAPPREDYLAYPDAPD